MCLNMAKLDNDWVNAINVGNEVMMLTDSAAMLRIDLDTLAYLGEKQWVNDSIPTRVGSAHPVLRPGTQTWVGVAAEMGLTSDKNHMEYFTFEGDVAGLQPRPVMGKTGNLKHPPFMHSYGVTPNYVVMPLDLGMGLGENCSSVGLLCGMVAQWQGIHVVDNNGVVTVFDTEPFYHVHVVNAFENATGVTLDVGAYHQAPFAATGALDIDLYLNKTTRDANPIRATMRRVHMHFSGPLAGKTTYQTFKKIPGSHSDFFRLNPNHIGLPYCYYYATQWWHDSSNYANMAIMKHDLCSDTTSYWSATDHYVGEPFFIPDPAGMHEDDGVLVFVALDGPNRRSKFMTLDAKTMQEVNGTAVHLDTHIPFTAHGTFFSDVLNPKSVRAIVV
jgi:carotenoid cleavage dioxygenase-like enzyme